MSDTIDSEETIEIIEGLAHHIEKQVHHLTCLDQAIGDGDHGINLTKGFRAVLGNLNRLKGKSVGTILEEVGMILVSQMGGAVGPLYGVAFMKAGEVAEDKMEVDVSDIAKMFEAAEHGIMEIGKAKLAEKTMLDAIHPATLEMKRAAEQNESLIMAFENSAKAAEAGMKSTIDMISKRGRSRYLGNRSRGYKDVGATSAYIMLRSASNSVRTLRQAR